MGGEYCNNPRVPLPGSQDRTVKVWDCEACLLISSSKPSCHKGQGMFLCAHMCACVCLLAYLCVVCARVCACIYIMYVCLCVCVCVCVCVLAYMCVIACKSVLLYFCVCVSVSVVPRATFNKF